MALYAPVINSYKRYVEGTWAPLNTTWGMDNRTCSIRIINAGKRAMRLENRVPGADMSCRDRGKDVSRDSERSEE